MLPPSGRQEVKSWKFGGKYNRFYSRSPVAKLLWLPVLLLVLWPSTLVQLAFQGWKQLQVNIGEGISGKIPQMVHLKGKQYKDGNLTGSTLRTLLIKEILHLYFSPLLDVCYLVQVSWLRLPEPRAHDTCPSASRWPRSSWHAGPVVLVVTPVQLGLSTNSAPVHQLCNKDCQSTSLKLYFLFHLIMGHTCHTEMIDNWHSCL